MSEKNGNSLAGYGKDPLTTSHGDALLDLNFQSLKSKEVRDSISPTHELKFHSMSLSQPNTTGWDVQTSSEVSPDGRAYRTETLAQTDGVEKLAGGGTAEFKGHNEQRSSASHQGDDKNYVKKAAESSNTQLQEKVVFGDESNGRTEMKMSSTTSSSTSKFVSSSSTTEFDEDAAKPRYLMDNQANNRHQQQQVHQQQRETREQQEREQRLQEQRFQEHRLQQQQQQQQQREERYSESREQSNSTRNVETQQHYEENKRYVDMDKASPEYQRHVQHLMSQPGEIISNTVEYPKPNVKMITTVKRLPDGTIVKNKRYETEQMQPAAESTLQTQTHTQSQTQNNQRRTQDVQHTNQTQTNKRDEQRDVVDNVKTVRHPTEAEELLKQESYSTVKKSSRVYSTEATSETIEEYDDRGQRQPSPGVPRQDFSTHGFPTVKANKPTQEFPNHRPSTPQSPRQPGSDFSTHGFPSVRANKPTQEFANQRPSIASGEDLIVVKSEQSRNVKQSSSSQRTTETEYIGDDHAPLTPFVEAPKRTGTPSWEQPASPRRPNVDDCSTHGFPSVRPRADQPDGDHVQHTSRTHSAMQKSNTERIIETQVEHDRDLSPEQQKGRRPQPLNAQPPASPRRTQPREDYGTQGFPSARSPTRSTPDASTRRSPLSKSPNRKPTHAAGTRTPGRSTTSSTETTTTTLTRRQLQKEREVDASHRAFAASLRSSSPAESTGSTGSHHRRESGHTDQHQAQRQTPRSSISSNRTCRRDAREGSHDSHAPSESSRISSTTVTRHVHGLPTIKNVGKTLVTKQQQHHTVAKSRNVQASNETIDLTPQRSPKSPTSTPADITKTTKTTTTTIIGGGATKPIPTPSATLTPTATPKAPSTPSIIPAAVPAATPAAVPVASSNNETPTTVSDNQSQYTYATTKPADIFSLPPTPSTPPTNTNNNNNHNNNEPTLTTNKNNNQNNNESESNTETITKTKLSTNDATVAGIAPPSTAAVNEPPCVRRNYYKLGPSDKEVLNTENQPADDIIATAVTSSETVASSKNRPHAIAPNRTPTNHRKPYHNSSTVEPDDDDVYDEPIPARRSSKSPSIERRSVQRETTFERPVECEFVPEPVAHIDDQIIIDESTIEVRQPKQIGIEKPREPSYRSPEKQLPAVVSSKPKELPRQSSPAKQLPAEFPSKPRELPLRNSPEKHVTSTLPLKPKEMSRQTSEKQLPTSTYKEVPPYSCPEKQLSKELPRQTQNPEKQSPGLIARESPRPRSPEKQLPDTIPSKPNELPRHSSSERQLPQKSSPEKQLSKSTQPQESPRQSPDRQLVVQPRDESRPDSFSPKPYDKSYQSSDREFTASVSTEPIEPEPRQSFERPLKPRDTQQPSQFKEDDLFKSTVSNQVTYTTNNASTEFIKNERQPQVIENLDNQSPKSQNSDMIDKASDNPSSKTPEIPDGSFVSKSLELDLEEGDNKPTFRKKGLSRRETFEDRCRKILGMEEDGDTQGNYSPKPQDEMDDSTDEQEKTILIKETVDVKIEVCLDDDDDDDNPRRVTETFVVRTQPVIKVEDPLSEPAAQLPHRSELTVDVTESEEFETFIATEKTIGKNTSKAVSGPAAGKQPRDEKEPRPVTGEQPKDQTIKQPRDGKAAGGKTPKVDREPHGKQHKDAVESRPTASTKLKGEQEPGSGTKKQPKAEAEPRLSPSKDPKDDAETININEATTIVISKRPSTPTSKSPSPTRKESETKHFVAEKIIDCNGKTVVEKITKTSRPVSTVVGPRTPMKKQPHHSEPEEMLHRQPEVTKPQSFQTEPERRNSRTTSSTTKLTTTNSTKNQHPAKETQPQTAKGVRKEFIPRSDSGKRDSLQEKTRTTTTTTTTRSTTPKERKPMETSSSPSIKDRLRSSPRKQKSQPDDVDGHLSSPDTSPSRISTERRRSSNISVHTEIIIDHTAPKTPSPKTERKAISKVITSPVRKLPVTERKESAPVPRVTRRDKDKVTRSTSENIIKVVNGNPRTAAEMSTLSPSTARAPTERSRPSKCFTTKTINLSEQLINSEDMENIIIDIQHAKSSREPSPDRIVPTPVHAELDIDTGKPRYPDTVQEPDDEPRKKPIVTNIPIFEEEANAYIGCQISELRNANGIEADIHDNPTVEAPKSLDYPISNNDLSSKPVDYDECLLSVHEKVSKFTHTAEQVKQPKSSKPFSRQFDEHAKISESDECLLSINQKVDKFLKTAENITQQPMSTTTTYQVVRPSFEDMDEELREDECTLSVSQKVHKFIDTAEKLAPSAPQKSPRLVANIERHISRQSEPELDQESEPEQPSHTELEPDELIDTLENETDDELLPMSKNHTTAIELKRQKDILSRPTVFTSRKPTTSKPLTQLTVNSPSPNRSSAFITEERKSIRSQQSQSNTSSPSPSPRSPTRKEGPLSPIKSSLEQTRSKPSTSTPKVSSLVENATLRSSQTSTKRREQITQEQWVLEPDVLLDDEEVGNIQSPTNQPISPNRQRTATKPSSTDFKSNVVKARTEHSTKHTTTKKTHTPTNPILASYPDTEPHVETLLERSSRPMALASATPGRTVASRRNIFEQKSPSPSPGSAPESSSEPSGRRPSYMDHTKSSLEHIRRDSLEFNKTHYSRKSSIDDDIVNPNASVKFDVPRRPSRPEAVRTVSTSEDIDIEQIFELQTLEQLLETVSSYELRRRIRGQIRLIKKKQINTGTTSNTIKNSPSYRQPLPPQPEQVQPRSSNSNISTPNGSPLTTRRKLEQLPQQPQQPRDRSHSPKTKSSNRRREQVDSFTGHGKPPVKPRDRSASPAQQRRRSPPGKSSLLTTTTTTSRTTTNSNVIPRSVQSSPERRGSKPNKVTEKPSPIWSDRSKVLRGNGTASNPGSVPNSGSSSPTPRKGSASSTTSGKLTRSSNTVSSSTTTTTNSSSKHREEDSITSSYGVGPTDENGLPLFGIRALKKKTQPAACETKQEVTGYVNEELYYEDGKSPPRHERKELIYSSNPDELVSLQRELERKPRTDINIKLEREFQHIDANADAIDVSTRRGSIKEISDRFIRKESSSSTSQVQSHGQYKLADEETEDSESNDVCSVIEVKAPQMRQSSSSSTTRTSNTRSFLNTSGEQRPVSSVDDVLERMRNADNVVEPGDSAEDQEARSMLNKFLGASVIMHGVESMLPVGPKRQQQSQLNRSNNNNSNIQAVKTTRISSSFSKSGNSSNTNSSSSNTNTNINSNSNITSSSNKKITSSSPVTRTTCDIEEIWDEPLLRQLLEQASTYEERRKIRARLRELMAEREAQNKQQSSTTSERTETKSKDGGAVVTTTTTKVTTRTVSGSAASKNISPLVKFKQLDKAAAQQQAQKSSPTTSTPTTPGGSTQPYFKFTDPALNARAATVKDQLLQWCQHKTQEYENVQISNFSSSWSDGLAFCALIHHFLPDAFDFSKLTKQTRRHNFELAFTVADEKAGIAPLLDVEDMVEMSRPDWKCVFVYVQSIYRRFRNCQ